MKKMVSLCALLALTLFQSCGSKSEAGAVLSLYQADHGAMNLPESNGVTSSTIKVLEESKTTTVKLNLRWEKDWDNSPKTQYNIERVHSFKLPETISALNRESFPGIAVIDLDRPNSETPLPKNLRCIYRQKAADKDFQFQFCTERKAPIVMDKLEKIKASAMNLIKSEHREKISFNLVAGDSISAYFAYPISIDKHGKTKLAHQAEVELQFLK